MKQRTYSAHERMEMVLREKALIARFRPDLDPDSAHVREQIEAYVERVATVPSWNTIALAPYWRHYAIGSYSPCTLGWKWAGDPLRREPLSRLMPRYIADDEGLRGLGNGAVVWVLSGAERIWGERAYYLFEAARHGVQFYEPPYIDYLMSLRGVSLTLPRSTAFDDVLRQLQEITSKAV